ncbi:platelet glycoprotein Ib alpha chain-like [Pezoporus flaviventris]|uniref:platelet glycoprotein Ib alpha chain-like n=1 Tax=Pezoporus flaviventris TaxID=889875 RepID=UPI002AB23456|nr:platelet glycoprotein Ib alpha chain-like [Pezoporus flaviventris]
MQLPALLLLLLLLPALPAPAGTSDPGQPCPVEMNKVKDLLEVNCTGQALSAVPPGLPADTGILLLGANRLVSVSIASFPPLPRLQDLDLSDNGLEALRAGPPLPALRELILSRNALQALPALQGLPALSRLALGHNRVAALPPGAFRAVPRLQDLDLRGNRLRTLPPDAFAGLGALKDLDVSDNALEELPRELLQDLRRLETLWLSGNRLRSLPSGFFPEGQLFMYVFLTENPWHCDCRLHYLRGWIRRNEGSVYQPERGLEKTKVEVAPERVLCHSPPEHQGKPIIHFKPNCANVGDEEEEEEEEDYGDGEETAGKAAKAAGSPPHPPIPTDSTAVPRAVTGPPPATPSTAPSEPSAPSTASPAPASATLTPTPAPSTATAAPARTPHRATASLPTPVAATATLPTTPVALPAPAVPEASSLATSSSPRLVSTTPLVTATHTRGTAGFTQPAPSPPAAPLPLCPCPTAGLEVPVLRSWAAGDALQGGHWVLDHCCLLHWVLYLACLALLALSALALAAWLCLVGWTSWHKSLQSREVPYLLLRRREAAGGPVRPLSSPKSLLQHTRFCTIKEVQLYPQVTYCTIKDLGTQCSPPASSFCTTKELWIHQSPLKASFRSLSRKLTVTNLGSLRTPPAYSLDRGLEAIGEVRVKYAGNTL